MYNMCHLTKLVVDQEGEQKVWEDSRAKREVAEGDGVDLERRKAKMDNKEPESSKTVKLQVSGVLILGCASHERR
jgi:hypothetical protein